MHLFSSLVGLALIILARGFALRLTAGWTAAIFIRFMAFRRIDYRSELWWSFSWSGDASRFLRVGLALAVMTSAIALDTLLNRVPLKTMEIRRSIPKEVRNLLAS